jgi:iron complex transport system permease protein
MIIIRVVTLTPGRSDVNEALPRSAPRTVVAEAEPRSWRAPLVLVGLALLLVGSCVVSLGLGPFPVPTSDVAQVLWSRVTGAPVPADVPRAADTVVWQLRVPRIVTGAMVGAVLAACGAALQAVVRNVLADPYLLGVSSGASLGAALVITLGLGSLVGAVTLAAGAFLGALLALALVLTLVRSGGRMASTRLVLAGVTVSYFLGAVTNLVVVFADSRDAVRAVTFWMLGSLGQSSWETVPVLVVTSVLTVVVLLLWSRRLDAVSLGDDVARSLGTDPVRLRTQVAVLASLGVASAVAVSGSIGFVGLVVPHLARRLVGATHRLVVTTSALLGAVVLVWADALARTVLAPREIPLGILTALIGTPLLMVLVRRQLARTESAS